MQIFRNFNCTKRILDVIFFCLITKYKEIHCRNIKLKNWFNLLKFFRRDNLPNYFGFSIVNKEYLFNFD